MTSAAVEVPPHLDAPPGPNVRCGSFATVARCPRICPVMKVEPAVPPNLLGHANGLETGAKLGCSENPRKISPRKRRFGAVHRAMKMMFRNHCFSEHDQAPLHRGRSEGSREPMNAKSVKPKRVAIYLRVSTAEQHTRNQRRELKAAAERHGWSVAAVYEDEGISGARSRDGRPGLDALLKAITRREFDMVAARSVDRLGRSLTDLLAVLGELHANRVGLYLHQQRLDTSTPSGRAMFQMMGVFAEFERAMIRERVMAGLARAREEGTKLGRRPIEKADANKATAIRALLARKTGVRRIARDLGVGVGTVIRIRDSRGTLNPTEA